MDENNETCSTWRAKKEVNPAKVYMQEYGRLLKRKQTLVERIQRAKENATKSTSRLKAVAISGTSKRDSMADHVLSYVEDEERLHVICEHIDEALACRRWMIDQLTDKRHRKLCTYRYIDGLDWLEICDKLHYCEAHIFRMHGEALQEILQFMKNES